VNAAVLKLRTQAQGLWKGLAPRERRGLSIAVAVLAVFAVWSLFVQPAWRTLQTAPAQLDRLESEFQRMQRLAAEAQELRGAAPVLPDQAAAALQAATARLGDGAKLSLIGDRATVTLTGTAPDALRAWLGEVRSAARARPVEAQLSQSGSGYSGTLTVTLEAAP
jgi:general secretion pathway protein M